MRIREITLRELHMPLVTPFETSVELTDVRRILLVEVHVERVSGWGECVAGEVPSYSPETTDTACIFFATTFGPRFGAKNLPARLPCGICSVTSAVTTWLKPRWKRLSGMLKQNSKVFRWPNSWEANAGKFLAVSRLGLKNR